MSVLSKIIERCKTAMRAGIPIIYIKTDSFQLIDEIVKSQELVMRLTETAQNSNIFRPYKEGDEKRLGNWNNDKMGNTNAWGCPHIVTLSVKTKLLSNGKSTLDETQESQLLEYIVNYFREDQSTEDMVRFMRASALILYKSEVVITNKIKQYCEIIDVEYPEYDEICDISREIIDKSGEIISDKTLQQLCGLLQGFEIQEIKFILNNYK